MHKLRKTSHRPRKRRSGLFDSVRRAHVAEILFSVRIATGRPCVRLAQILILGSISALGTYPNVVRGAPCRATRFGPFVKDKDMYMANSVQEWGLPNPPDAAKYRFSPHARKDLTIFDIGDQQRCEDILAQPASWSLREVGGRPVVVFETSPPIHICLWNTC